MLVCDCFGVYCDSDAGAAREAVSLDLEAAIGFELFDQLAGDLVAAPVLAPAGSTRNAGGDADISELVAVAGEADFLLTHYYND